MFYFSKFQSVRHGISIIEVLTSTVVAMIGVFGVMILIPFAVKQAQTGLNQDAATVVARNAFAQFEIGGFRAFEINQDSASPNFNRPEFLWFDGDPGDPGLPDGERVLQDAPRVLSIDPLAITENGNDYDGTDFPINRPPGNTYPDGTASTFNYVFDAVNLVTVASLSL